MSKNDGGPAFPQFMGFATNPEGMTLRDWFAGQAIGPILDDAAKLLLMTDTMPSPAEMARATYKIADAMLSERDK